MIDFSTYSWSLIAGAGHPDATNYFGMIGAGNSALLFGGTGPGGSYQQKTWLYRYATDVWEEITTTTVPARRNYPSLAYNPTGNYVLMFGGLSNTGAALNDTLKFDLSTEQWTLLSPAHSPTVTDYHSTGGPMVWDGTQFLLYTQTVSGGVVTPRIWKFDGTDWTQLTYTTNPNNNFGVSNDRHWPSGCLLDGKLTIFGGAGDGPKPIEDATRSGALGPAWGTYQYNTSTPDWVAVTTAGHPNAHPDSSGTGDSTTTRMFVPYGMASTSDGTQAIFYGGRLNDVGLTHTVEEDDTWELSSGAWTQLISVSAPGARSDHGMAWDNTQQRFIMYGGINHSGSFTETWEFVGPATPTPPPASPTIITLSHTFGLS